MIAKRQFGLINYPFPKAAQGKTFFDKSPGYARLALSFQHLVEEPGLATLCADAGLGKTAAMRHLCSKLPQPDYQVIYLCDTTIAPVDLYRALALELGVRPSHRRSQVWADLKKALLHLVDERGTHPIVVIDEAQHLSATRPRPATAARCSRIARRSERLADPAAPARRELPPLRPAKGLRRMAPSTATDVRAARPQTSCRCDTGRTIC